MEEWEYSIQKAMQNIEAMNLLSMNNLWPLVAYHAQQAMEHSIKGCAYKLGFLDYVKKKYSFYNHNPSRIVLSYVYDYLQELIQRVDNSEVEPDLKSGIAETMQLFQNFNKLLKDAESGNTKKSL